VRRLCYNRKKQSGVGAGNTDAASNHRKDEFQVATSDSNTPHKPCSICEQEKPLIEFPKRSNKCKICKYAETRAWKLANKERVSEYNRTYGQSHKKEREQRDLKNADHIRNKSREWRKQHAEQELDKVRRWRKANPEKHLAQNRRSHANCRARRNAYSLANWRTYYTREKWLIYTQTRRARKTKNGGTFTLQEWNDLKAFYGYKCLACDRYEPEIKLTPDHVVPLSRGGRNDIQNIQPLCSHCNNRKRAKTIDYRDSKQ